MTHPASILIVDDNKANRTLLRDLCLFIGHTPILAENGFAAIEKMELQLPDLVLLDIIMPEMNGYEVLSRMKSDENLRHIPVIMISAVEEVDSVARCIRDGADDYLSKPFNTTLLKARISASLEKKRLRDQEKGYQEKIEAYNLCLEKQVREKTRELSEANKRLKILDKAKNDFLSLIAHELRTPLNGVFGAGGILSDDTTDTATREQFKSIFQDSCKRLLTIVDEAILLSQIEVSGDAFPLENVSMQTIIASAIEIATRLAESRKVHIRQISKCEKPLLCEEYLTIKAFIALMETAVKFSSPENAVEVSCDMAKNGFLVTICAKSGSIPEDAIPKFFEVFSIAKPITPGGDLGLGPPVAERILRLFGGSVTVSNQEPQGVVFKVWLKKADTAADDKICMMPPSEG